MALIICPECKKEVSDKSKVCIHCGFPIASMEPDIPQVGAAQFEANNAIHTVGENNTQNTDFSPSMNQPTAFNQVEPKTIGEQMTYNPDNAFYKQIPQQNVVPSQSVSVKKKRIIKIVILIVILVMLAGIAIGGIILFSPKPMTVEGVKTGEWEKNYYKEYGMKITSEQKEPFVALIEMSEDDSTYEKYVYMENGEGEITKLRSKTSNDDELPKEKARAIGFYEGTAVTDSFLKNIDTKYRAGNWMEEMNWKRMKKYMDSSDFYKMAVFTVDTYGEKTGLMIYDVSTNLNKSVDKNRIMPIIKGKGISSITYFLEEADKEKNFDAKFIPRFFISAEEISADQYDILTKLNLDGEESPEDDDGIKTREWEGTEKISLKNNTSGLLLYKVTRTKGDPVVRSWMFENDYKEWYGVEQAKNKIVNIHVSQNFSLLAGKPEYKIDIMGYLNYKDFASGKETLKENKNGVGDIFDNLTNEAQKQKEAEESREREESEKKRKEEEERNYFKNIQSEIGASDYYVTVSGDGSYMEIDTNPLDLDDHSSSTAWSYIKEANKKMGFSESLANAMSNTRALDGTQTEENDKIKVRWTFHPNAGLEVTYTKK